jgi:hypothetical protein
LRRELPPPSCQSISTPFRNPELRTAQAESVTDAPTSVQSVSVGRRY